VEKAWSGRLAVWVIVYQGPSKGSKLGLDFPPPRTLAGYWSPLFFQSLSQSLTPAVSDSHPKFVRAPSTYLPLTPIISDKATRERERSQVPDTRISYLPNRPRGVVF